jgi:flagellum-specific peptidoglycan hydrolase FlgJ
MMDPIKQAWIENAAKEAAVAGHVFAEMAAAEAALESNFGQSGLAREGNNLFGVKQHNHPLFGTITIPTREFLGNGWTVVNADWIKYPTLAACFSDRMATLIRLSNDYPHYAMALQAPDEYTYINEVSRSWSTDPARAASVTAIYRQYFLTAPLSLSAQDL